MPHYSVWQQRSVCVFVCATHCRTSTLLATLHANWPLMLFHSNKAAAAGRCARIAKNAPSKVVKATTMAKSGVKSEERCILQCCTLHIVCRFVANSRSHDMSVCEFIGICRRHLRHFTYVLPTSVDV